MKKIFLAIIASLITISTMWAQTSSTANRLYISDFNVLPNTATTVSVNMANSNAISGFQFDLVLPSGVTLNSVTRSSARTSYTYSITRKAQADGSIRIVCIASGAAAAKFTGTDGEVLKLSLTSTSTGNKTIRLKNQILTESDLDEVTGVESTASMHVHNVTAHSATAATCTATGNTAYWYCSGCSKYFRNSTCTTETTLAAATIAALGHNLTSTDNGNGTHTTTCSRCDYSTTASHTFVSGVCSTCGCEEQVQEDDTDVSSLTNAIYVDRVKCSKGGKLDLKIKIKNSFDIYGFQFSLALPEGISVESWHLDSSRLPSGASNTAMESFNDNVFTLACALQGGKHFVGSNGTIATVTLNVGSNMSEGLYPINISNCSLGNSDSQDISTSDIKSTLEIVRYIVGDANSDGYVKIGDVLSVLNYIVGNTPPNFNVNAADANGDGFIKIGDVLAILNLIVNQ